MFYLFSDRQERGVRFPESFDVDEETRFSSVYRGGVADDSGYGEEEDIRLGSWNTETFGSDPTSVMIGSLDGTDTDATQVSARSSSTVPLPHFIVSMLHDMPYADDLILLLPSGVPSNMVHINPSCVAFSHKKDNVPGWAICRPAVLSCFICPMFDLS